MPHLSGQITPWGPLINVVVHVSGPRSTALEKAGLVIPTPQIARLVVDTGASATAIDESILKPLGVMPTGQIAIHTPSTQGQPHSCNQYDVGITLLGGANEVVYLNTALPIIEGQFKAQGIDGLLGRDVLAKSRMTYLGHDDWYCISF